ncbi:MAG: GNAT family N-acetyltransferase [Eubacteriales bacterium]
MVIRTINNNEQERLTAFLKEMDSAFPIPLSTKVDIGTYSYKVLSKGIVLCNESSGKITGVLLGYANDVLTKSAYISTLVILEEYRNSGLGSLLISHMKWFCRNRGMNTLSVFVHKCNKNAIRFYQQNGFIISDLALERGDDILMKIQL